MRELGGSKETPENLNMGTWRQEPLRERKEGEEEGKKKKTKKGMMMIAMVELSLYRPSSLCKIYFVGCYKLMIGQSSFNFKWESELLGFWTLYIVRYSRK
jgi:hypothetical protein